MAKSKLNCIYLDMDGVLADFCGGALELFGVDKFYAKDIKCWNGHLNVLSERLGRTVSGNEFWRRINSEGSRFWANLEWLPWGIGLLYTCIEFAPVVLMTTPSLHPSSAAGKIEWINKNMPKDLQRRYALTPCKHHMAHPGAMLIDDNEKNINKFNEHGGKGFLWPRSWNNSEHHFEDDDDKIKAQAKLVKELCLFQIL